MIAETATPQARLHPFFTGQRNVPQTPKSDGGGQDSDVGPDSTVKAAQDSASEDGECASTGSNARRSKKRASDQGNTEDEPAKRGRGRPSKKRKQCSYSITNHFAHPDVETSGNAGIGAKATNVDSVRGAETSGGAMPNAIRSALEAIPADHATEASEPAPPPDQDEPIKAKKMLKFNLKTGTLGSPPKAKEPSTETSSDSKASPKTMGKKRASLVVHIKYGMADDNSRVRMVNRIKEILDGRRPALDTSTTGLPPGCGAAQQSSKKEETDPAASSKPTHPFFLSKQKTTGESSGTPAPEREGPSSLASKRFTSTPCSPKRPHTTAMDAYRAPSASSIQFGVMHTGLRVPGARLPAWPWKGMAHVHGDNDCFQRTASKPASHSLPSRKSKGNASVVSPSESVMANAASRLNLTALVKRVKDENLDDFQPPPPELRLPRRHCESGRKLQLRIKSSLRATRFAPAKGRNHGLPEFFESIRRNLSAYDRSQCESSSWTQKYCPMSAVEVLQPERETSLLREWLIALKVQSVDTGTGAADSSVGFGKRGPKAAEVVKRKRKRNKLDGFVVSSDDEANEMDELSETEDDLASNSRPGFAKKTVIRTGDTATKGGRDASRLKNAVVISGPHGCGKTAAVYAVAGELGFEVFEISPSSRRSGKDILEKIGDMTRNHLIQQHQAGGTSVTPKSDEGGSGEDQVARDVQSGKQATMNSFFKPKAGSKKSQPNSSTLAAIEAKKPPTKSQKQSLILLEEVDILYEEDKQFWATVFTLIAQSKRPFVLTCNDEALVPIQSLSLHGIFRFSAPRVDLAVDRLLMMAASEGHVLSRDCVEALYESRNHDLRASITELNYWCQMGVGDRRGGFDWFFLRWPKGIDQDENGDTVRVISEGTFTEGMGWLGRDAMDSSSSGHLNEETDVLQQAWNHFDLDLGLWQDSQPQEMVRWAESLAPLTASRDGRLTALTTYDNFADAMSIADLCSPMVSGLSSKLALDPTLPELLPKARDDFTCGLPLVEVTPRRSFDCTHTAVSICLKTLARRDLRSRLQPLSLKTSGLFAMQGNRAITAIRQHLVEAHPSTPAISRLDFAIAFDPIAVSDEPPSGQPAVHLDPSVWDRTLAVVTLDAAPFVRGIVEYEARLQHQRLKLSSLLSQGGTGMSKDGAGTGPKKRMRTTRAAYSAMEGSSRSTTRAERWFKADLNPYSVRSTAPRGCIVMEEVEATASVVHGDDDANSDRAGTDDQLALSSEPDLQPTEDNGRSKLDKVLTKRGRPRGGANSKKPKGKKIRRSVVVEESSDVDAPFEWEDELAA